MKKQLLGEKEVLGDKRTLSCISLQMPSLPKLGYPEQVGQRSQRSRAHLGVFGREDDMSLQTEECGCEKVACSLQAGALWLSQLRRYLSSFCVSATHQTGAGQQLQIMQATGQLKYQISLPIDI